MHEYSASGDWTGQLLKQGERAQRLSPCMLVQRYARGQRVAAARVVPHGREVNRPTDIHRVFLFSGMRGGQCVAAARVVPKEA